ncbi:hypothetical protein [Streptomyces sp. WAC08241]|uniref:hypothetical protein n=1 Tax=Streptomyces sp. WAC08241 TaxID=2487421 RepID=UPI000F778952|nr:hypothetical protein [Streptomyces sp. WAC08241]RSS46638.1 hypothetical protein EF906_01680 [Streptomyces sp. WAC08241]
MPDTAATAAAVLAAPAGQGLGDTLRIVLLVSLVGGVLLAWFLLRGYRTDDTDGTDDTGRTDGAGGADGGADRNTERDANA